MHNFEMKTFVSSHMIHHHGLCATLLNVAMDFSQNVPWIHKTAVFEFFDINPAVQII